MRRRDMLTRSVVGGLLGAAAPAAASAGQAGGAGSERALDRVSDAIDAVRNELRNERLFTEIASIRNAQKQFLRANGKLPDFIDVGADVWFEVYDWHVRWQQPIAQSRDPQGRLTLALNQTLVVLRPEVLGTYVGLPYDGR